MFEHTPSTFSILAKRCLFAGLFLALLGLVAAPASAQDVHSYMKTGILNVMPDHYLSVSVTDVGAIDSGSDISIKVYDGDGGILEKSTMYLAGGKTLTLKVRESQIPNASPDFQMRVVIDRVWQPGSGSQPITTIEIIHADGLVAQTKHSCGGPAARNPDPDTQANCPGIWQAGWIVP